MSRLALYRSQRNAGFTIIELVVVIFVLGLLGFVVAFTYSSVRADNRDNNRQAEIDSLQSDLELVYAQVDHYPTLANLNDATWRKTNMPSTENDVLIDPSWSAKVTTCTADGKAVLAGQPAGACYSYQVTAADGSACNNTDHICTRYSLTATLENGDKYVKTSFN